MSKSSSLAATEIALLSNMLFSSDARHAADGVITGSDFEDKRHGVLFDAIMEIMSRGGTVNPVTVHEELIRGGSGDSIDLEGILQIASAGPIDPLAAPEYAVSIREAAGKRAAADLARLMAKAADDPTRSYEQIASEISHKLTQLTERHAPTDFVHISQVLPEVQHEIEEGIVSGQPTGYPALDRILRGGMKPGQLIVLAGGTGSGKTAFALNVALNVGREAFKQSKKLPVLIFSLEMKRGELVHRLVMIEGQLRDGLDDNWQFSEADKERAKAGLAKLDKYPLHIQDRGSATVGGIRRQVERFIGMSGQPSLVIIDYLQLLSPPEGRRTGNRTEEVGEMSRGLKLLAHDLNIPVLALSQLNRDYMKRPGHQPSTADLRESGSIENDADAILFVHRDTYHIEDRAERARMEEGPTDAKIIVAKQRSGPAGEANLTYIAKITAFMAKADRDTPPDAMWSEVLSEFGPAAVAEAQAADTAEWGAPETASDEWA